MIPLKETITTESKPNAPSTSIKSQHNSTNFSLNITLIKSTEKRIYSLNNLRRDLSLKKDLPQQIYLHSTAENTHFLQSWVKNYFKLLKRLNTKWKINERREKMRKNLPCIEGPSSS